MSESIEHAMHEANEASNALVQERSAKTLQRLQDHFKRFANVPAEGRVVWIATHHAQLLSQAEQAFMACEKFLAVSFLQIAPGIMAINSENAESATKAQQTHEGLRLTTTVLSLFDHYKEADFAEQAELVIDIFEFLHKVVVGGAMPKIVEKRTNAVQLLAKKRAELSVHELQVELSALGFGSYEKSDVEAPLANVYALLGKAITVNGFYLALVSCDVEVAGKVNAEANTEATKTSYMMQAINMAANMMDSVNMFERADLHASSHAISVLFKRMGELLTVTSEFVPEPPTGKGPSTDNEPLGENIVLLGDRQKGAKKKRTLN
jgi:hypothetical protein